jgi:excisionase family DNA binding protein
MGRCVCATSFPPQQHFFNPYHGRLFMSVYCDELTTAAPSAGPNDVLSVPDVMALLGCQRSKVYEMFHAGDLAGFRVGRSVKVFRGSVEAYRARTANKVAAVMDMPSPAQPRPPRASRRPRTHLPPPRVAGYGHGL